MRSFVFILLLMNWPINAQIIYDFTDEVNRVMVEMNEGFAIGNGCSDDMDTAVYNGNLDMNFNTLELMSKHFIVTGNLVNEAEIIYACDVSYLEVRGGTLEVPEISKEALKIYPNPAINEINIQGVEISSLELFDISGRRLKHYKTHGQLHKIRIDGLDSGIYLLIINGNVHRKIVKT